MTKLDNSIVTEPDVEVVETAYITDEPADKPDEVVEETVEKSDDELAEELAKTDDDDTSDVESKTEPEKPVKHLSKEESKIVALKKQNQKLLEDYRALANRIEEIETASKHTELKKQYIDKGIDEEEADSYAKKDIESSKTIKRLELLEFKLDNDDILKEYPDSKNDLQRIMNTVKTSGMTVEQVCRGLYGFAEPIRETRAKAAAKGELEDKDDSTSVATAQRTSTRTTPQTVLTKNDLEEKRRFENAFRGGEKMSNAEWLERKNKYFNR